MMQPRNSIPAFTLAVASLLAAGPSPSGPLAGAPTPHETATYGDDRVPSHEEIVALVERAIANQHLDDDALDAYERVERRVVRGAGKDARILEDKTYRLVPAGTGSLKLLLKDSGKPVDLETYRQELQTWVQALEIALRPDDPRQRQAFAKWQKRRKERAALVDATRLAFHASQPGRETVDGRTLVKLQLEPNPQFKPTSTSAEILTHTRATVWIDEQSGHLARAEADIIRDISFGGGILGKVYRGGHLELLQSEVAPGVWLPTRYQFDFSARKFLFGFGVHRFTEASHYRRLSPLSHALEIARHDLESGRAFGGDP